MELKINRLAKKNYQFEWIDPMHNTRVEVDVPDLTKLKYSLWGDWGPMYTFQINEHDSLKIRYNGENVDSTQKTLRVDSPLLFSERIHHPYVLKVEDDIRHLAFHLYLDPDLNVGNIFECLGRWN